MNKGYTLAEVMVSVVLLAAAMAMVSSVILTVRVHGRHSDRREQVALYSRALEEELKNYVKPEVGVPAAGAPGSPAWHFPSDPCTGCPGGPSCWALAVCEHDASVLLPPEFRAPPYNATMRYTVAPVTLVNGQTVLKTQIHVQWDEPAL